MHALNVTVGVKQTLRIRVLDDVQLLGDAESALASDQPAIDALNYSPINRIIFASVFQSPNMLRQFAFARINPVVDALIVNSEPILESR